MLYLVVVSSGWWLIIEDNFEGLLQPFLFLLHLPCNFWLILSQKVLHGKKLRPIFKESFTPSKALRRPKADLVFETFHSVCVRKETLIGFQNITVKLKDIFLH